jgi:hypothetical protein
VFSFTIRGKILLGNAAQAWFNEITIAGDNPVTQQNVG